MKRTDSSLKEFCRTISDEEIRFLNIRFHQNHSGDRAEVLDVLSKHPVADRYLTLASTSEEFFDCYDHIGDLIKQEAERRKKMAVINHKLKS